MKSLISLSAPWIQRTSGVLLVNLKDQKPRTLFVKGSHDKSVEKILISVISPDCELWQRKIFHAIKLK